MLKYYPLTFILLLISIPCFTQKNTLQLGDYYLEDQLYIIATYNNLINQPETVKSSGFSYGFEAGFIKDLPLNKNRNFGVGVGVGYTFDSFNHGLKIIENNNQINFEVDNSLITNTFKTHNIAFPLEIRWRTSTAKKYNFWRIYSGIKITYNFSNSFNYNNTTTNATFSNINKYNNWQTGFTFAAGYGAFNAYFYYGLSPIFKNATLNDVNIDTKIIKFGLAFYIL